LGNTKVFPLVFLTVLFIITASRLVKYQTDLLEFYESINNEIDHILEELKHEKIVESKIIYNKLKEQIKGNNNEDILPRLIEIKDKLLRNLESDS